MALPLRKELLIFLRLPLTRPNFKLYFERVRHNVRQIHLIEDLEDVANPFNFFNIYLKPVA